MALDFDNGDDGGLSFGDFSAAQDLAEFTACMWIYPTGWGENNYGRLLCKELATPAGWTFFLTNYGDVQGVQSLAFLRWRATADTNLRGADNAIVLNTWQWVAVRYNATAAQLWIDGAEISSYIAETNGTGAVSSDVGADLRTANRAALDRDFDGRQEDVRLYSRYLPDDEMSAIYHSNGHDGIWQGLIGRWPLCEKSPGQTIGSDSAYDVCNHNDGTPDYSGTEYAEGHIVKRRKVI